jgi:TPR repeat protein
MIQHLVVAALLLAVTAAPSRADFADGLAAYDAGDYQTSVAEWRPLAEAGDPEAQVALAGLYLDGLGVARDQAEGARWYRLAAEQGEPVAQMNLGDLYSRGQGVPRDLAQAYLWLSLSAAQGRAWAERRRQDLARTMSGEDLAAAERLLAARGAKQ